MREREGVCKGGGEEGEGVKARERGSEGGGREEGNEGRVMLTDLHFSLGAQAEGHARHVSLLALVEGHLCPPTVLQLPLLPEGLVARQLGEHSSFYSIG